jgi:hypothetical protein
MQGTFPYGIFQPRRDVLRAIFRSEFEINFKSLLAPKRAMDQAASLEAAPVKAAR